MFTLENNTLVNNILRKSICDKSPQVCLSSLNVYTSHARVVCTSLGPVARHYSMQEVKALPRLHMRRLV